MLSSILLFSLVGSADAAPAPGKELAEYRQAEAYREAMDNREANAVASVTGGDSLTEALASQLLRAKARSGEFKATDDGYQYLVSVGWGASGSITSTLKQVGSALGSATRGERFCFGDGDDIRGRLTVADNMADAFLDQLGVSADAIEPRDQILGQIKNEPVALNTSTMGSVLFSGVLGALEGARSPVDLRLTLYAPKPLVADDADDVLRVTTKKKRVIEIPVEIIGDVAKLDPEAVKAARWRISGTSREIPLDLGYAVQRALFTTALKTGAARLDDLSKEVVYPVARQKVALPKQEMHLLGDRNAWYGMQTMEAKATVSAQRTSGDCDIELAFTARDSEVAVGPLPAGAWPQIKSFRLIDPAQTNTSLAYLDEPSEGRDPGGVSNPDFDERLTRAGRCDAACNAIPSLYEARMAAARAAWINEAREASRSGDVDESEYTAPKYRFAETFDAERCVEVCNASKGYAQCVEDLALGPNDFLRGLDICQAKSPLR
ncbi:MAG: hypothetical protein VX265_13910 [Myxococcota bacterium]|nr:hypothetical protein [Myxococcota bacterium]